MNSSDTPCPSPRRGDRGTGKQRLASLDILRGLALFGMILAHFQKFLSEPGAAPTDNIIATLIALFVAEKDRIVFAFLFGTGFAVMLKKLQQGAASVTPIYLRRLTALYALGFLVEAITPFHILREYAWWGIALLFLRDLPTRTLLLLAVLSTTAFSLRDIVDDSYLILTQGREAVVEQASAHRLDWEAAQAATREKFAHANWGEAVGMRVAHMGRELFSLKTFTPNYYLALFLLGLVAVRHGIIDKPLQHRGILVATILVGTGIWAFDWTVLSRLPDDLITPRIGVHLRGGLGILDEKFLGLAQIAATLLLLAMSPLSVRLLAPFATVGRMALTNYVVHAIIIDALAAPYGLQQRLSPERQVLAAALLLLALWTFSRLWLVHFRYGPLEWLWRSATYRQWQPLRIAHTASRA